MSDINKVFALSVYQERQCIKPAPVYALQRILTEQ